jgi:DNA-binding NtrC family response regulator
MSERSMDYAAVTDHTPAKQTTILLVEDMERALRTLHAFLQRRGYEVIGVGTGEEAEKWITGRGSENIAVIVSDINLDLDSK